MRFIPARRAHVRLAAQCRLGTHPDCFRSPSVLRLVLQLETSRFSEVEWHLVADRGTSILSESRLQGIMARLPAVTLDLQPRASCWIHLRGRTPDPAFFPICLHPSLESYVRAVVVGEALWLPFLGLVFGVAVLSTHFGIVFRQRLFLVNALLVIVYGTCLTIHSGYWAWLGFPATRWIMWKPMLAVFWVTSFSVWSPMVAFSSPKLGEPCSPVRIHASIPVDCPMSLQNR